MSSPMTNAVRKIHNLLSSGAVTVTGPNQSRILNHRVGNTNVTPANSVQQQSGASGVVGATNTMGAGGDSTTSRCYICDEPQPLNSTPLIELQTTHTSTKFPNKIGQVVGDGYIVVVSSDDVVCGRCTNLVNYLDRLESDVERMRTNLVNLLNKKYGMYEESVAGSPPTKMQKLNSGTGARTTEDSGEGTRIRKTVVNVESPSNKHSPSVSSVQQMKIATQSSGTPTTNTQTVHRKTARIYKCMSCDYKTSDMRLFNVHYETCKQQNFQCKNCKKIFPNFGSMKQHMMRDHNTPMEFTCAVCHINFVNENALRRHMECNHSTNVLVTSTTTLPVSAVAAASVGEPAQQAHPTVQIQQLPQQQQPSQQLVITTGGTVAAASPTTAVPLYTCNHCQYKSTDKVVFDEHMRKHVSGSKTKPFKCRLCSQRFESREAATVHAKQHQPSYFKCGTCSISFGRRDLLVKHFEVHQHENAAAALQQHNAQILMKQEAQAKKQQQQQQQHSASVTTQKLLQETIDEALSDSVATTLSSANSNDVVSVAASGADNINFFSCHLCSLTFLQETYYNQHMETHQPEKKATMTGLVSGAGENIVGAGATIVTTATGMGGGGGVVSNTQLGTTMTSAASAMITDGLAKADDVHGGVASHQNSTNVGANISDADIESLFEKMHSDKGDSATTGGSDAGSVVVVTSGSTTTTNTTGVATGAGGQQDNLVITSQEGTGGGITFNITIPQTEAGSTATTQSMAGGNGQNKAKTISPVSVSIDMPMLDEATSNVTGGKPLNSIVQNEQADALAEKGDGKGTPVSAAGPVNMPSLDDDSEAQQTQSAAEIDGGHDKEAATDSGKANDPSHSTDKGTEQDQQQQQQQEQEEQHHKDVDAANEVAESEGGLANEAHNTAHEDVDVIKEEQQQLEQQHQQSNASDEHHHHQHHHQQQVAMELEEAMQTPVDGGQIKFVLNENGELLQLDNHIITDADGNQILVQDPEQIQQLLQTVGLDGETTLQMVTDDTGHMILVQGENNAQIIDESLLNADGQLVIQQGQDGELGEGAHVIGEDGTRIPVSVSYTADGQPIVQVQQQVMEAASNASEKDDGTGAGSDGGIDQQPHVKQEPSDNASADNSSSSSAAAAGGNNTTTYFALDELMERPADAKSPE